MTFDFEERAGDLIENVTGNESVVLYSSQDFKLVNKGLTNTFRQRYGSQLSAQKKTVGQVAYVTMHGQRRHVFYLIVTPKSYNKANYSDIESCLISLRKLCEQLDVRQLALARELGVGLQEKYIKDVLFNVFQGKLARMSSEEEPLFSRNSHGQSHWNRLRKSTMLIRAVCVFSLLISLAAGTWIVQAFLTSPEIDFSSLKDYCKDVSAIQPDEYTVRHQQLAETLKKEGADALIMEGGASMVYYTNIEWGLTERAFMVVLQLNETEATGIHTTIITPAFESTRAKESLKHAHLPDTIQPGMVEWLEYKSPFASLGELLTNSERVMVEQNARLFIYRGVSEALSDTKVEMAPRSIRMLRMIKSDGELDIMRCANTVTELAIRTVRPHIKIGMTEFDIQKLMTRALKEAGLTNTWVLALVDENAALPHGSSSEQRVKEDSTVLIDTGGEFLRYQSDVTRTFFMGQRGTNNQTIEDAWYLVRRAQENVLNRTGAGMNCAQVDLTARHVIEKGNFGPFFTHRLGHGLGLEMHEEPYMNQGNREQYLAPGMTFSVEPGIYVTHEFGIRLEDPVVVRQDGKLELLTIGLAQNPWTL
ncbi:hypothetical protein INT47_000328 [Mucor saturninus]|uniref:Uncharacterized protein n=1 Tax=Mucor saturninus TaxID=64648 RepID=A0A8H7QYB5_9FUNG|nr:hypothetical protein INT47_000328 [Mucor saturninus]